MGRSSVEIVAMVAMVAMVANGVFACFLIVVGRVLHSDFERGS